MVSDRKILQAYKAVKADSVKELKSLEKMARKLTQRPFERLLKDTEKIAGGVAESTQGANFEKLRKGDRKLLGDMKRKVGVVVNNYQKASKMARSVERDLNRLASALKFAPAKKLALKYAGRFRKFALVYEVCAKEAKKVLSLLQKAVREPNDIEFGLIKSSRAYKETFGIYPKDLTYYWLSDIREMRNGNYF